jgi:hypothetical protein
MFFLDFLVSEESSGTRQTQGIEILQEEAG